MKQHLERLTWGIATGWGLLGLLWEHCPCWDEPTKKQQIIMLFTLMPLCLVMMAYILAVSPVCFVIAAIVDRLEGNV